MDLGRLNINLYRCISDKIDTDHVIITDEQLDHIAGNHPEAYDETLIELKSTLQDPDYIFEDRSHRETGLVVRAIPSTDNHLFIVLRVCTNSDHGRLSNSVISGWKISRKRLENYLRNKQILYRRL